MSISSNRATIIADLYRARRAIPFTWGENDCITWSGDVALAITGIDPIASIRGQYRTKGEARRLMEQNGCASLPEVAAKAYQAIQPAMAQTGDWAVIKNPKGTETIGVVVGPNVIAPNGKGLCRVPRTTATAAFRVA